MRDFTTKFLIAFIPIFVAIDAIGMVAIFIGLGANVEPKRRQQEALLGIGTALAISVGFMFLGKLVFQALGITVADFQVAGGLILLAFAVRDLLDVGGEKRPTTEAFGIVPLGGGRFRFSRSDVCVLTDHIEPAALIDTDQPLEDEHPDVTDDAATTRWDGSRLDHHYAVAGLAQARSHERACTISHAG